MDWCTIESDPGVFTSLITKLGVTGASFTELYSLDEDSLPEQAHGLIFLFKYTSQTQTDNKASDEVNGYEVVKEDEIYEKCGDLFFAKQVVTNACATQAILGVLLNCEANSEPSTKISSTLNIGSTLTELKNFSTSFPPALLGELIGSSTPIKDAHNSFTFQNPFTPDEKTYAKDGDDVFHFIAYVNKGDTVYEIDGLKSGPVKLGNVVEGGGSGGMEWLKIASKRIQQRIAKYGDTGIKFNLMAIVEDQRIGLTKLLNNNDGLEGGLDAETTSNLMAQLQDENWKYEEWKRENERRQHNYVPFIFELVKSLAGEGKLRGVMEVAKEEREKAAKAKGKM